MCHWRCSVDQEQLKVAGFWHQLDANNREDNSKGYNDIVDEDNDDGNIIKEMPEGLVEVARMEVQS